MGLFRLECGVLALIARTLATVSAVFTITVQGYQVNTIAADALAPCVAKPSAAVIFTMLDKLVLVFYEERFQ